MDLGHDVFPLGGFRFNFKELDPNLDRSIHPENYRKRLIRADLRRKFKRDH